MNHVLKTAADAAAAGGVVSVMFAGITTYTARERRRRRKDNDPYIAWLEDALGPNTVSRFRATRAQMRAARRELKTVSPAMFTSPPKERTSDDC